MNRNSYSIEQQNDLRDQGRCVALQLQVLFGLPTSRTEIFGIHSCLYFWFSILLMCLGGPSTCILPLTWQTWISSCPGCLRYLMNQPANGTNQSIHRSLLPILFLFLPLSVTLLFKEPLKNKKETTFMTQWPQTSYMTIKNRQDNL